MKLHRYSPTNRLSALGFTLAEIMVAVVVASIILLLMIQSTVGALDTWKANRDNARAARQAEIAIDQIFKDFESIQMRPGNKYEWLYSRVDDSGADDAVSGGTAAKLAFFTGATDRYNGQLGVTGADKGGDVSAVSYRLIYKDPIKNDTNDYAVFALYRNLTDPDKAFADLIGQEELLASGGNTGPMKDSMDATGVLTNFISENIYRFSLSFLIAYEKQARDGTKVTEFKRITVINTGGENAVKELRIKGNGIYVTPEPSGYEAIRSGRIVSVDIGVTVISETAMDIIREGSLTGEALDAAIDKNSYRFTKTATLPHS